MVRIFIAGVTGVIGRELVPILLSRPDHRIIAAVSDSARAHRLFADRIETVECDLLGPSVSDVLDRLLDGVDIAIHIATRVPKDKSAPGAWDQHSRLRTEFTEHLVRSSLRRGVRHLICQSIEMAYPDNGDGMITESSELDTLPERSRTSGPVRRMEELVISAGPSSMTWTILRGGSFVGKGTDEEDLISRMREGMEMMPVNPEAYQSYVTPGEFADAVALCVEKRPRNTVFNVNQDPVRYIDYLRNLSAVYGVPVPVRVDHGRRLVSFRCDNSKIRRELGWEPRPLPAAGTVPKSA